MAASMEYVPREALGSSGLILADFSHGKLNVTDESASLQPPKFSFYKHKDQEDLRRKNQRILVAESNSMQYVGQNYGIHAPKHVLNCKYYVGVLDKESGKMRVYDAQSFHLRPWFGESQGEEENASAPAKEEMSFVQKNDRLTEAFGSSRKQRALESRLRSAVTSQALETLANKAVEHAQFKPQTSFIPDDEADISGILPPCNRKAQSLKDVYHLASIISPDCMEMLQQLPDIGELTAATKEQVAEWRTQQKFSDYILGHLENLPGDAEDRHQRVCVLVYMHYLRKMYATSSKEIKANKVIIAEGLSDAFNQHLLDSFTQISASVDGLRKQRCFPKKLKEKVLVHMLTLALLIDEFKTNLLTLQRGLTAQMQMFRNHARVLGCKVKVISSKPPRVGKRGIRSRTDALTPQTETDEVKADQIIAELCLPSEFSRKMPKGKRK